MPTVFTKPPESEAATGLAQIFGANGSMGGACDADERPACRLKRLFDATSMIEFSLANNNDSCIHMFSNYVRSFYSEIGGYCDPDYSMAYFYEDLNVESVVVGDSSFPRFLEQYPSGFGGVKEVVVAVIDFTATFFRGDFPAGDALCQDLILDDGVASVSARQFFMCLRSTDAPVSIVRPM